MVDYVPFFSAVHLRTRQRIIKIGQHLAKLLFSFFMAHSIVVNFVSARICHGNSVCPSPTIRAIHTCFVSKWLNIITVSRTV